MCLYVMICYDMLRYDMSMGLKYDPNSFYFFLRHFSQGHLVMIKFIAKFKCPVSSQSMQSIRCASNFDTRFDLSKVKTIKHRLI